MRNTAKIKHYSIKNSKGSEFSWNLPSNSDNESNLWLILDEEGTVGLGVSSVLNESSISSLVLVEVLLSIGEC